MKCRSPRPVLRFSLLGMRTRDPHPLHNNKSAKGRAPSFYHFRVTYDSGILSSSMTARHGKSGAKDADGPPAEVRGGAPSYFNLAYSALAASRTGMSGSASFQSVRKSR